MMPDNNAEELEELQGHTPTAAQADPYVDAISHEGCTKENCVASFLRTPSSYEVRKCDTKHYAPTGRSGSPSDPVWLEAHREEIEESISATSRNTRYSHNGEDNQQTMLEVDRELDRIMEIRRKAVKNALCQFIYRCEQEAEDQADADSSSESSESNDSDLDHVPGDRNNRLRSMDMDINMTEE